MVTPLCLSLLLHLVGLTVIESTDWLRGPALEPVVERTYTIEAGTVSPEDLERISLAPELPNEGRHQGSKASPLSPTMFPERRDTGPDGSGSGGGAVARYPEEELPILSRTELSDRTHTLVRDGELDAVDPGPAQVTYIKSSRRVGLMPSVSLPAAPKLGDDARRLIDSIPGSKTGLTALGTAPPLRLGAPPPDAVSAGLAAGTLDRGVEDLFAPDGPPVPMRPLPLDVKIDVYAEPGSRDRYFRMTVRERQPGKLPVIAKNVLFVIDISVSIRLSMLEKVRSAVAGAAAGLNRADRFNVVRFSEQSYKAFDGFVPATAANVRRAAATVHREHGQVRTDVYTALREVLTDLARNGQAGNRPTNIYLVTDGNATTGMQDIRHIVNDISLVTRPNYSIFAVNPGARTANAYLLDLLAYRNRGVFTRAASEDVADATVLGLLMQFKNPVLTGLRAYYANFEVDQVYPKRLPNLYSGKPIVIHGRCLPGDTIAIQIIGESVADRRKFLYRNALPDLVTKDKTIAREWARGKIHYLSSLIARDGEKKSYRDEITRLSKRYGLASPYE